MGENKERGRVKVKVRVQKYGEIGTPKELQVSLLFTLLNGTVTKT